MAEPARSYRFSLQAKVMAAVVAVLVALPIITLVIVDQRLRDQMQLDANLALSTARASFVQALKMRNNELALRFRSGLYDQRFLKILLEVKDAATMQAFLQQDVLSEYHDTELALFV